MALIQTSTKKNSLESGRRILALLELAVKSISAQSEDYDWVGIYVLNNGVLELGPFVGATPEHTRIKVGEGVCGKAVELNCDQNVPDVRECKHYLSCSIATRSELVVLIKDPRGQILGLVDIDSDKLGAFSEDDEVKVRHLANELGELWSG